ncbi:MULTISPECIES: hypothetical protein [unclassified Microbacterium]|uniref:hypothetical protein n=1 Tax=unclassified Microbacterium TaxID=2609290 RepID=UPI0012DF2998|nr:MULTISPECIES: hypothetical protein [unclassified Microbacterium]
MIRANSSALPTIAFVVIVVGMIVFGEIAHGRIVQAIAAEQLHDRHRRGVQPWCPEY